MTLLLKRKLRNNGEKFPSVFSSLVEDFINESIPSWAGYSTSPRVNIREKDKNFDIEMAVPGFQKDDFKIELDDRVLTVSAKKESVKEEEDDGITRKEFDYSSFCRSFTLPESVEADSIKCNYENGLLKINVPKKEGAAEAKKTFSVS